MTIEHSVPNVYVINYLYDLHESISREELSSVLKSLECTIITKEENDRLNKRYKTTMPDGWKFGDNIFVRYEKMDIEIINIAK